MPQLDEVLHRERALAGRREKRLRDRARRGKTLKCATVDTWAAKVVELLADLAPADVVHILNRAAAPAWRQIERDEARKESET